MTIPMPRPASRACRQLLPGPLLRYREAVRLALGASALTGEVPDELGAAPSSRAGARPTRADRSRLGRRHRLDDDRRERHVAAAGGGGPRGALRAGAERAGTPAICCGSFAVCSTRPIGGVGMRRGRRDAASPAVGDAIDFWRVEAIEAPTDSCVCAPRCTCRARPGCEWQVEPTRDGGAHVTPDRSLPPGGPVGPRLLDRGRTVPPVHLPGPPRRHLR